MKGDHIPGTDHVSRYCRGSAINEDGTIDGSAFRLRHNEDFLSVNWLEYIRAHARSDQIAEIKKVLAGKLGIGSKARIAVLNVNKLREYVMAESSDRRLLSVLHEPEEPKDPSHSGIFNMKIDDDLIADLLAEVIQESYPAK